MIKFEKIHRQLLFLIGMPILSLTFLGSFLFLSIRAELLAQLQREQARETQLEANRLLKNFLDQETGVRGYLLEHDNLFLDPYKKAHEGVDQRFMELSRLVAGDPAERGLLNAIDSSYRNWEALTTAVLSPNVTMALRRNYDIEGERLMDSLRQKMQTFIAAAQRSEMRGDEHATADLTTLYGCFLALLVISGSAFAFASVRIWLNLSRAYETQIAEIERLATHDDLTGLPNRLHLDRKLSGLIDEARRLRRPLAVFHIDLDRFKRLNDGFGPAVGNEVLRTTANRLRNIFRDSAILARVSGDEFIGVVPGLDVEYVGTFSDDLLKSAMHPVELDHLHVPLSISAGIAVQTTNGTGSEDLRRQAAQALQVAQQDGGGAHRIYNDRIAGLFRRRSRIIDEVKKALDKDEGFEVVYQPIFSPDRRLHAIEALLRFNHPVDGPIPPNEFIPAAEESGLILSLSRWALRNICKEIGGWEREGCLVPIVSINVSTLQLLQPGFAFETAQEFLSAGISPKGITLELTESTVISNLELAREQIQQLHMHGFRIAVDDFGTGYSSLAYLQELEIDTLKIDRSFVNRIGTSRESIVIVRAIIELAHALGMRTVAEGVESEDQLLCLKELGCNFIQGFLFARPLPADSIMGLFARH